MVEDGVERLKSLLENIDLSCFDNMNPVDLKRSEEILFDLYKENWKNSLQNKPKLRTYRKLSQTFEARPYVKMNISRYHRSILAQLKCGVLPINIEAGRFRNLRVAERVCPICNSGEVEEKSYFIFKIYSI